MPKQLPGLDSRPNQDQDSKERPKTPATMYILLIGYNKIWQRLSRPSF